MQQQQRKYALERVTQLLAVKTKRLSEAHAVEPKHLSAEERCELVRDRKVRLRPDVKRIEQYTDVTSVFDFSKHESRDSHDAKYAPALKALNRDADRVRDQIMLGDATEALRLLDAFAAE